MAQPGEYSIATRLDPAQQVREPRFELLAAAVDQFLARQGVEVVPLDRVHQRPGLAFARNQVVPAPRGQMGAAIDPGEAGGDGIRAVEVVEQPSVETAVAQRALDGGNVERHGRPSV